MEWAVPRQEKATGEIDARQEAAAGTAARVAGSTTAPEERPARQGLRLLESSPPASFWHAEQKGPN